MRKLLALHGYGQSSTSFAKMIGMQMLKLHNKLYVFTFKGGITQKGLFAQGVVKIPEPEMKSFYERLGSSTPVDGDNYKWYVLYRLGNTRWDAQTLANGDKHYNGASESVKYIEQLAFIEGPFEGILGYSQGGAFAMYLSALQQHKRLSFSFNYVINVAGFVPADKSMNVYFKDVEIPSLHLLGANDTMISNFDACLSVFRSQKVLKHSGGHTVPKGQQEITEIVSFVENYK